MKRVKPFPIYKNNISHFGICAIQVRAKSFRSIITNTLFLNSLIKHTTLHALYIKIVHQYLVVVQKIVSPMH